MEYKWSINSRKDKTYVELKMEEYLMEIRMEDILKKWKLQIPSKMSKFKISKKIQNGSQPYEYQTDKCKLKFQNGRQPQTIQNTSGTRGDPGGCYRTLVVKIRKNTQKSAFRKKKHQNIGGNKFSASGVSTKWVKSKRRNAACTNTH